MSSEFKKYINSFIDEKHAFFHQEALNIFNVLVEDNFSYNEESKKNLYQQLSINQNKYKDKIIEYLQLNNYNNREVISLNRNLDTFYNQCFKRSILLKNKLESLYSKQTITNDNENDVKSKMLDAIDYEMKTYIGKLLERERKMLQNALIKTPPRQPQLQLQQYSQQPQQLQQYSQQPQQLPRPIQWQPPPPPREELPPTPQTQQSSQPKQSSQQRRASQSPLLPQRPHEQQQPAPRLLPIPQVQQQLQHQHQQQQQQQQQKQQKQQQQQQQQQQQPAPRLLPRPPVQQQQQQHQQHQQHQQQQMQQKQQKQQKQQMQQMQQTQQTQQMQQTRQLQQKQKGEDMANLLRTYFYKTKYNKTKDGSGEVMKFKITIVPRIKYTEDNDVIIDMIKGDSQINIETTNKYVYNFKEKKIINDIQDINIFLNGSNLKSIKYFLKPRKSGPYLEITINIPFIILSDDDTHIYLTNTDISSSGTDINLGDYILSLIDIIKNYVRKQDPISFL